MAGPVPTIHVFAAPIACVAQDADARHKGEHDGCGATRALSGNGRKIS
jgi:hypothetical protein